MSPSRYPYLARRWLQAGLAAVLLVAASLSPSARAAPDVPTAAGDLDTSFGGFGEAGRLLTPVDGALTFRDAVQLPDGAVIAVGSNGEDFVIAKYTRTGELDTSFGAFSGTQIVNLSLTGDSANTVAIAAGGKIVVAGAAGTGTGANFGLVRLNADGSLDSSFGNGGIKTIDFNGRRDIARAVSVHDDDLFVAGTADEVSVFCGSACPSNIAVARLNGTDGELDGNFGAGGKVQTNLAGAESGLALVVGPCGFYTAGARAADLNAPPQFVIASYTTALGTANTFFGNSGVVTGTTFTRIVDLACLPNGTLLALGDGPGDGDDASDVGLLNLASNGDPVSGFGTGGLTKLDFGGVDVAGALQVLPDYTAVVAGSSGLQLAEVRFSEQGSVVTGTLTLTDLAEAGATAVQALDVALVPDLRFRAVASVETDAGALLALTRRFLDGSPDDGGRQVLDFHRQEDQAATVVFQPDGKLLVAGSTKPNSGEGAGLIARYTVVGGLDPQFGMGGPKVMDELKDGARGIVLQPDGKIVVMGLAFDLVRLTEDGAEDEAFGVQGYASANWFGARSGEVVRQGDGKLILAGARSIGSSNPTFAVARFMPDGDLDGTFGAGGLVVTSVGAYSAGQDAAIQPDGKIVVAGFTASDGDNLLTYDFALVRYLPDGNLDNTFGANGRVTTDFFGFGEIAFAVLALPDGKIVAAGYTEQGVVLARYLPTGALDPSFGAGGKVLLPATSGEAIVDLVLDGPHLMAAICSTNFETGVVARLTPDGAFANSFNGNGRAPFNFPGDGCPMAIAAAPGRIAAVGSTRAGVGFYSAFLSRDFAVAMYLNDPSLNERLATFLPVVMGGP